MSRLETPEFKQNNISFPVSLASDPERVVWKATAIHLQDLFGSESRKLGTYMPFVVELGNPYHYYHENLWRFLPAGDDCTQAVKAVKTTVKDEIAKYIPEAMRNGTNYRMIKRKVQPPPSSKSFGIRIDWGMQPRISYGVNLNKPIEGEMQPTVIVLVKPNSCLQWFIVESQIEAAMNKVDFPKTMEMYLEFGTGDKPPNSSEKTPANQERHAEILRHIAAGGAPNVFRPKEV